MLQFVFGKLHALLKYLTLLTYDTTILIAENVTDLVLRDSENAGTHMR